MKTRIELFVALLLFSMAPCAIAQRQTFTIDAAASQIAIILGATGHDVHGTFHVQTGSIEFDRTAATISGSVIVAAGSGDTGNASRDHKMLTEVLDATDFAQITFAPTNYQGTIATSGDSELQISGVFTLHGTQHHITMPAQIHIDGTTLTAKAHFVIPYVQWGLKDPSVFILKVAKEVAVDIILTGSLTQ